MNFILNAKNKKIQFFDGDIQKIQSVKTLNR